MVRTAARTRAVRTVRPSRTVGAWRVLNDGKSSSFEPPCSPIGESVPRAAGLRPHRLARLAAVGYHIAPSYVPQLHRLPLRASLSGCSWQARRRRRHGPDAGADEAFHEELAGQARAREVVAPPRRGIPGGQRRSVRAKRPPRRPHATAIESLAHRTGNVIGLLPDPRVVDEQFGDAGGARQTAAASASAPFGIRGEGISTLAQAMRHGQISFLGSVNSGGYVCRAGYVARLMVWDVW